MPADTGKTGPRGQSSASKYFRAAAASSESPEPLAITSIDADAQSYRVVSTQIEKTSKQQRIADAQEFALFGRGDAGIGGDPIVMIEACRRRRRRQGSATHFAEHFLEADQVFAGAGVAWWDGTTCARIAALEGDFANPKSNRIIFIFPE